MAGKIKFSNPKKSDVLIFHEGHTAMLNEAVLYDIDYSVLPANREEFYLTPQILAYFIKNLILNFRLFLKYRSKYQIYILACVDYVRPSIVISFRHTCFLFQTISRVYQGAKFYAIQNGVINTFTVTDSLPKPPNRWGTSISMPHLICFGKYEEDLHSRYGHKIDNFYPVGSLVGGYYKTTAADKDVCIEFDFCLVSEWRDEVMNSDEFPEHKKCYSILYPFLSDYIKEKNRSLCIVLARNDSREKDYFRKIYGNNISMIERSGMSSYAAMERSRVVLAFYSAAALEAFGWGKKVLFCNFAGNSKHDFPIDGFWFLNRSDYAEFKKRMDYLYEIDDEDYLRCTKEVSRYVMNYDFSMPAHTHIRNIILKCLKEKEVS